MTEETDLNITEPQQQKHRTLLDEAIIGYDRLETVVENEEDEYEENGEEPLYAQVIKPKLTEYGSIQSPPHGKMTTFQQSPPPNSRQLHQSPEKDRKPLRSPALVRNGEFQNNTVEDDNDDGEANENLGFAFSFLNSQENSPQLSQKSSTENSENNATAMELTTTTSSPPRIHSNRIYRDLSTQNQRTDADEVDGNIPDEITVEVRIVKSLFIHRLYSYNC